MKPPRLDLEALTPEFQGLLFAALLIGVALFAAWAVGRMIGARFESWVDARAPNLAGGFVGRICTITRFSAATLLLAAFSGLEIVGVTGRIMIVGTFGIATALLLYQVARGLRFGTTLAALVALVIAIGVVAGWLGGLDPLTIGLDRAAISFGKSRISLLDVLNFALIAALLFGAARVAVRALNRSIGNVGSLDLSQRVLFQKFASIGVIALAFVVGIDVLGIDLTALAVFSGAFGLAVGFGFQKTFGNLISGLILLLDRSIKPGDVIVVGDTFGWVNKIGVRAVSVLTRDGKEHLIPNEQLMTEPVENWSYSDRNVRVHLPVGVSYGSDLRRAQALMIAAAKENPRVLDNPAPVSWITEFGDSSVNFDVRFWIDDPETGIANVKGDVMMRIWDLFKENDVEFPFPQQDVHIKSLPRADKD